MRQGESPESQGDARTVGVWDTPKSGLGLRKSTGWLEGARGGENMGVGFKTVKIYTTY